MCNDDLRMSGLIGYTDKCVAEITSPLETSLPPRIRDEYVGLQWLRYYATNRKVAGSIPAGVSGFFIDIKSFRSHYGLGVDSASNRKEYQEYFLGVKTAGA